MNNRSAILRMIIVALLWSTGGILVKSIDLHPLAINSGRSILALMILVPYVLLHPNKTMKSHLTLRTARPYILSGLCISALSLTFVSATKMTTAAHAIVLQFTSPVWVLVITWLIYRKAPIRKDYITVLFMLCGLMLFTGDTSGNSSLAGNLMATLSGISMAAMVLYLKHDTIRYPILSIIMANAISGLIGLPTLLNSSILLKDLMFLILIGVFQYSLSYLIYCSAIKNISGINTILITTLEPILNPVWVFLFIGETISTMAMIGGAILIITMLAYNLTGTRKYA